MQYEKDTEATTTPVLKSQRNERIASSAFTAMVCNVVPYPKIVLDQLVGINT
jgi:hypothetical protein